VSFRLVLPKLIEPCRLGFDSALTVEDSNERLGVPEGVVHWVVIMLCPS
jgi:hypothetical protein